MYDYIPLAERVQYGNSIIANIENQELVMCEAARGETLQRLDTAFLLFPFI